MIAKDKYRERYSSALKGFNETKDTSDKHSEYDRELHMLRTEYPENYDDMINSADSADKGD